MVFFLSVSEYQLTLRQGWVAFSGSSVSELLGLGRSSAASDKLSGMVLARYTGNGTHISSGSLLLAILVFILA